MLDLSGLSAWEIHFKSWIRVNPRVVPRDCFPMPVLIPIVPEIEEGLVAHLFVVEDAVKNLQFGDALPLYMLLDPAKLRVFEHIRLVKIAGRNPPVAFSEQSNEKHRGARAAAIDLLQANTQRFPAFALLFRDPPSQIHLQNFDKPLLCPPPKLGEYLFNQLIPLFDEIAECGADKNADEAGLGGHGVCSRKN
jgi:hypothetical protein